MGKGKEMITLRELKEKAVSQQQQKLMGLALAYKRGEVEDSKVSDTVKDLAKSMSTKELEDFASTKHKGLPQTKEDNNVSNRSAALKPQVYNDPNTGRKKVRMVPSTTNIVKTNDRVDEEMDPTKHVSKKGDMYCVYNKDGKEVAKFDDEEKANAYARKNHDKLMEYLEVGTDAIRKSYASMTPGQNEALAPIDRVAIAGTVALGAKGISKAKKTVGNLAKKVTNLGSKTKPIASKPKPIVNKPKPIVNKPKTDTSADTTAPNKRPMPAKSNFSNLRKRQQTRAKTKMGAKKTPIRRV